MNNWDNTKLITDFSHKFISKSKIFHFNLKKKNIFFLFQDVAPNMNTILKRIRIYLGYLYIRRIYRYIDDNILNNSILLGIILD